MGLRLLFLLALLLPEVPMEVNRAYESASLWHPLGWDELGREGVLRLGVGAARSLGFASATALVATGWGALLALGSQRFESARSVLRTLPPLLLILPVADRVGNLGWGPLALGLGLLLGFHVEPPLRVRFHGFREGPALAQTRVLGASPWQAFRCWAPWVAAQCLPLFPSVWLGAFWSEVTLRMLGLGPGPTSDSFGMVLNETLPRLVTEPTPLGIASFVIAMVLALWASPWGTQPRSRHEPAGPDHSPLRITR